MQADSFLGVPVYASNGEAVGLLVAVDDDAFGQRHEHVMRSFAARAGAELWRDEPTERGEPFTPGEWQVELVMGTGEVRRHSFVVTANAEGPVLEVSIGR